MSQEDDGVTTPTFVVVVGMNRPRLKKIMSMVEEQKESGELMALQKTDLNLISFVPCVATMGEYEGEDGTMISYLMNVTHLLDGSTMKGYLDDEDFRSGLKKILLVGYEWKEIGAQQIQTFFASNGLNDVSTECVKPNSDFQSLSEEMEFFKNLDEDSKKAQLTSNNMGPGKMAKFVIDKALEATKKDEKPTEEDVKDEGAEVVAAAQTDSKVENTPSSDPVQKPIVRPTINPNLPRYACRMCRTVLFGEDCLASVHVQNLHSFKRANFNAKRPTISCQSIFCSEVVLEWLAPDGADIEGRLACPKCSFKLGHWKWSGAQCSCGTWVTPAIQIPASKVDKIQPTTAASAASSSTLPVNAVIHPSVIGSRS